MKKIKRKIRYVIQEIMQMSLINRWLVLVIDLILCIIGFSVGVFIQITSSKIDLVGSKLLQAGAIYLVSLFISFYTLKSYRGLTRHSNLIDLWRPSVSIIFSSVILYTYLIVAGYSFDFLLFFVQNVSLISLVLLIFMRYFMVLIYNFGINYSIGKQHKALIYELDSHSIALSNWLNNSAGNQYQVKGFLTRNKDARRTRIQNLPVHYLNGDSLDWFFRKHDVNSIIFPDYMCVRKEQSFISTCIEMGITMMVTPPFEGLDSGEQIQFKMKPIQFEDLLGREGIKINMDKIALQTNGKVILITGSAGSIGGELVRQLAGFKPKLVLLFDFAETPLHNLKLELERDYPELKFIAIIGDVRNVNRLDFVFRSYHPQIVYHAAAYKHVPMMEENPCEAVLVNVLGTSNLSNKALEYNVESFVMISTDKAVNPTNIMGASKRIAEIYVQSLAKKCQKEGSTINFVTTRFGNVLGSSGSVIPYFKEQIEKGGPITVTHPDIIRYFMTIPEACRLVLEAASFGCTGQIYVFDMGSPVKIVDLAKRMIELAGFIPEKDIKIEFIGLRPGEKLYEELLNDKETEIPTEHEKITVASVRQYEFEKVVNSIESIINYSINVDVKKTVSAMKKLVPEFKSKNSPFEEYDG